MKRKDKNKESGRRARGNEPGTTVSMAKKDKAREGRARDKDCKDQRRN